MATAAVAVSGTVVSSCSPSSGPSAAPRRPSPQAGYSGLRRLQSSQPGSCSAQGLGGNAAALRRIKLHSSGPAVNTQRRSLTVSATSQFDYDVVIIGAGVGGHGAALHAVSKGLKTAIIESKDIGGTCVNRGCVPSKALLAASGRLRELRNASHLKQFGIQVGSVSYDRQGIADHANLLAKKVQGNLANSMKALGVDILEGVGSIQGPQVVGFGKTYPEKSISARDIIIATGSTPFVPPGITVDGKTVFTSDHALKMEWVPNWVCIVGSGYIGLEFSDVYTALGSDVTFVEALDNLMPGFDPEIARMAQRILIQPRNIDYHTGVLAQTITPGVNGGPVRIELVDFKTREPKDVLEVDAALIATGRAPYTKGLDLITVDADTDRRGFVPVNDKFQVLNTEGKPVPHLYCIGDANGLMMLAHAASAQGISVIENVCGNDNLLNHLSVPAACFTHPEISFAGLTQPQAEEKAAAEGFKIKVAKTSFKANSKALAENEGEGMAKMIYRGDTGEILGVHIIGMHAADLIHEASNAIATGQTVEDIKFNVHAHPTLSEVLDELFKHASVDSPVNSSHANDVKQPALVH
eukprot:jgi/Chlat1/7589/Chrsp63S07089